jgi:hypothetical protein
MLPMFTRSRLQQQQQGSSAAGERPPDSRGGSGSSPACCTPSLCSWSPPWLARTDLACGTSLALTIAAYRSSASVNSWLAW